MGTYLKLTKKQQLISTQAIDMVTGKMLWHTGTLMGGIKIAHQGTQNHAPSKAEIQQLLQTHYGITQAL